MDPIFNIVLERMQLAFDTLESRIEKPKTVIVGGNPVFRYSTNSVEQAIIQKMARFLSGLRAARLLLEHGYVQEQGAIQRMLDEFHEDITFLALSRTNDTLTKLHQEYLDAFYMEEFDESSQGATKYPHRPMIKREKIRSYTNRVLFPAVDTGSAKSVSTKVSKAYSGFIHGASPHIMDMYGGNPPKFHTAGMLGTIRVGEHRDDLRNYYYRGLLSFIAASKAFGDAALVNDLYYLVNQLQNEYGDDLLKPMCP